jgi:hypothetical protein
MKHFPFVLITSPSSILVMAWFFYSGYPVMGVIVSMLVGISGFLAEAYLNDL